MRIILACTAPDRTVHGDGRADWREMTQNADAITANARSGGGLLYKAFDKADQLKKIRLHLIGHSAGAIAHSFLIDRLSKAGLTFESV